MTKANFSNSNKHRIFLWKWNLSVLWAAKIHYRYCSSKCTIGCWYIILIYWPTYIKQCFKKNVTKDFGSSKNCSNGDQLGKKNRHSWVFNICGNQEVTIPTYHKVYIYRMMRLTINVFFLLNAATQLCATLKQSFDILWFKLWSIKKSLSIFPIKNKVGSIVVAQGCVATT